MASYWQNRLIDSQTKLTNSSIKATNTQLRKYYKTAMETCIKDFEATYNKLLKTVAAGEEPTPADLYKLDKYWQMQGSLNKELQKLGDKEVALMSQNFEQHYSNIYNSIKLPSTPTYNSISTRNAKQMVNGIWCADGKNWSQRVWGNTSKLQQALNDKLIECVATGKTTSQMKNILMQQFGVDYNRASTLVRTELTYIETQAATDRYKDIGIEEYEFIGRDEDDTCECSELNGQKFKLSEQKIGINCPPMHPNCRCCIAPVISGKR